LDRWRIRTINRVRKINGSRAAVSAIFIATADRLSEYTAGCSALEFQKASWFGGERCPDAALAAKKRMRSIPN
jgi:hypothetical protein